jgi:hypothetical protein
MPIDKAYTVVIKDEAGNEVNKFEATAAQYTQVLQVFGAA